ncbi:MAG: PAS domain S-box protein [Candidatus Eisenbacteria bacterium]
MMDRITKLGYARAVLLAAGFGALNWIADCILNAYVLHEGSFGQQLLAPGPTAVWSRSSVMALALAFGVGVQIAAARRRPAGKYLTESDTSVRAAFDSVQTGFMIIDPARHTIVDVNPAAVRMIGVPKEDIVGSVCHKFVCPAELGQCPITDLDQTVDSSERVLLTSQGSFPIAKTVIPIVVAGRRYLLESFTDVTERNRAEEALRHSEQRYRTIFENAPDVIYSLSADGARITSLSPAFQSITGWSPDEWIGKTMDLLVHPDDIELATETFRQALRGERPAPYQLRILAKSGEYLVGEFTSVPQIEGGEIVGEFGIVRDITARRKTEETLVHRLAIENAISRVSTWLINANDLARALDDAMGVIGRLTGAGRSYIFLICEDGNTMDNTHAWCAEGVEPQMQNLQNLACGMFPWWIGRLRAGQVINVTDVSAMPAEAAGEKEMLEAQKIKSVLAFPLNVSNRLAGFVGLDNVSKAGNWSEPDISMLRTVSEIIGSAIERRRTEEELLLRMRELENLNRLAVDRELRMIEMKEEVNKLLAERSVKKKYEIPR